jgi:hypothetical protein
MTATIVPSAGRRGSPQLADHRHEITTITTTIIMPMIITAWF